MAVSSSCRWLAASAATLIFLAPALAQDTNTTITVQNTTVAVDATTLAPAAVTVSNTTTGDGTLLTPAETVQLTDEVVANLTDIALVNASLFAFDDGDDTTLDKRSGSCKVFPGDAAWPSTFVWWVFDLLLGGKLITTVPLAASCYNDFGDYSASTCTSVDDNWTNSTMHMNDPTSVMWPLYQGRTCMPTSYATYENCTLGGYPSYVVNVSTVSQIQLAVNFARNANLRLVVKNTGHDFNGKSAGAGALSIWTHHLKDITVIPKYVSKSYTGQAVKMGAGVQAFEIYAAAKAGGFSVVGGEGRTVGVAGGFLAGGGHSPLSSLYGMAADQVLAIDVVTPDGRFVTATPEINTDLFWALRGGGGSTFGVVTSVTSRTKPKMQVTTAKFSFATSTNVTSDIFWAGVRAYFNYFIDNTDAGTYAYFSVFNTGTDSFSFSMAPFWAPNLTLAQTQTLLAPWFADLAELGISVTPVYGHYDNFYDAWWAVFPLETVGSTSLKTASRLFPKSNWANDTSLNATFSAIKSTIVSGGSLLAFNIAAAPAAGYPDNAVNPAWRETCLHAILALGFDGTANSTTVASTISVLTTDWMQQWRDVSPTAGAYMSEADISEPNFQQAFYGTNYARLYALKKQFDPKSLFYAPTAVGSEEWYITGQVDYLPTQDGRLCRV
ncbi:FAD-binding-containing protein [Coleophoma crateriformis]|uniref:FAD-binding-containing protein n=1 Tax=Coleophoma crateriformis TaxID=565419 RepID=A0A3D8SH70_9HELO|nr:FAD-binding-containing protein [Coleophoma crateriformis]